MYFETSSLTNRQLEIALAVEHAYHSAGTPDAHQGGLEEVHLDEYEALSSLGDDDMVRWIDADPEDEPQNLVVVYDEHELAFAASK